MVGGGEGVEEKEEGEGSVEEGEGEGKNFEGGGGSVSEKQLHLQDSCLISFNLYPRFM